MEALEPSGDAERAERQRQRAPPPATQARIRPGSKAQQGEGDELASATTAAGSEIVEDLLLAGALLGELCADLLGEAQEHFAAHLDRELGRVPGQIEAGAAADSTRAEKAGKADGPFRSI
jgi:hypothetical protein